MPCAEWKNVNVFISSTFSDMHAERDYLVRYVFPQLREWCAQRHLYLNDIDLRWGVTVADSENGNTVEVCLNGIDESRPFFLCFLGQRRGTVFTEQDISEDSLRKFPGLHDFAGLESVTEIEVEHALLSPMARIVEEKEIRPERAERSLFFFRRNCFAGVDLNPEQAKIYTNSRAQDPKEADRYLEEFKNRVRSFWPDVCEYDCRFDPKIPSPELNVWSPEAGRGRLCGFSVDGRPLSEQVIESLKKMILEEYPERALPCEFTDRSSMTEIRRAELANGYLENAALARTVKDYLEDASSVPLLIRGGTGSGKSSFLAHIAETSGGFPAVLRFCAHESISDMWRELASAWDADLQDCADEELTDRLYSLLDSHAPVLILLDDITASDEGLQALRMIPERLPARVKMIGTVGESSETAPQIDYMVRNGLTLECRMPARLEATQKRQIIDRYLSRNFKALDDDVKNILIESDMTDNPLFLTIILRELRSFGVFEELQSEIESYGTEPEQAFTHILDTLETYSGYTDTPAVELVPFLFGLLAVSRHGIKRSDMRRAFLTRFPERNPEDMEYYLRCMKPYLRDSEEIEILYEGLRSAAAEKYSALSEYLHGLLAEIYETADPLECSFHLRAVSNTDHLKELYADPAFWLNFIKISGGRKLSSEIRQLPEGVVSEAQQSVAESCANAFSRFPDLAAPLIYKESTDPLFREKVLTMCEKPFLRFEPSVITEKETLLQPAYASYYRETATLQCAAPAAQLIFRLVGGGLVEIVSMASAEPTDRFRIETEAPVRLYLTGDAALFAVLTSSKELLIYEIALENGRFLFKSLLNSDNVSTIRFGGPCAFSTDEEIVWQDSSGILKSFSKNGLSQAGTPSGRLCGAWSIPDKILAFKQEDGYSLCISDENTPEMTSLSLSEKPLDIKEYRGDWIVSTDGLCLYRLEKGTLKVLGRTELSSPVCSMSTLGDILLLADMENRFSMIDNNFNLQLFGRLTEDAYLDTIFEVFPSGRNVFQSGNHGFGKIVLKEANEKKEKAVDYRRFRLLDKEEKEAAEKRFRETGSMRGGYKMNTDGILTTPDGSISVPHSSIDLYHLAVFDDMAAVLSLKAIKEWSVLTVYSGTEQIYKREIPPAENVSGLISSNRSFYLVRPDSLSEMSPESGFNERQFPFHLDQYSKSPRPAIKDDTVIAYYLEGNSLHLISALDGRLLITFPVCDAVADVQTALNEEASYLLTDSDGDEFLVYIER